MSENNFQLHELYVMDGFRICEYTTRFGARRFDMQKWNGERTIRVPYENADGTWFVKEFPIEFPNAHSGLKTA